MVYKIVTINYEEYLISAEDIELAIDLWTRSTNRKALQIRDINRYSDIRDVLEACYDTTEEQLEALIGAVCACLPLHSEKRQDIANVIAYDCSGVSGMVTKLERKDD